MTDEMIVRAILIKILFRLKSWGIISFQRHRGSRGNDNSIPYTRVGVVQTVSTLYLADNFTKMENVGLDNY